MTDRIIRNISAGDLQLSKRFYIRLLDVKVAQERDDYIRFVARDNPDLEFAVTKREHDRAVIEDDAISEDVYTTFVVDDVDAFYNRAVSMGVKIVRAPRNELCGPRRFVVKDPDGSLVDISSTVKSRQFDRAATV